MWNSEYISEVDYLYGYFTEQSPERLKLALLSRGIAHSVGDSPTYLELGFGQGLTLAINAATGAGDYFGTDFNPSQVANAKELAEVCGKPITIFDDSFEELAARPGLPMFDIISLHGIWSWISESSRQAILRIAREHLKPGGIFYVSYNVTPGWSPAVPLRHLMSQFGSRASSGGILSRVDQSIEMVQRVIDAGALYFQANPNLAERLQSIRGQDKLYVAHEYFNANWEPMPFSYVSDRLSESKLGFGASANILDNIPGISLPEAARQIIDELEDVALKETVRDYFVNQQFRRDIFVKGPRRISDFDMVKAIDRQSFVALNKSEDRPRKVVTGSGQADLLDAVYDPVAEAMAAGNQAPRQVADILAHPSCSKLTRWQVWEALLVLTATGHVSTVSGSPTAEADEKSSQALNARICEKAEAQVNMQFLAAPRIGAAVPVNRIEQLFLRQMSLGSKNIPEAVWHTLEQQGQSLMFEGKSVEGREANIAKLKELFVEFSLNGIPRLISLGAIDPALQASS